MSALLDDLFAVLSDHGINEDDDRDLLRGLVVEQGWGSLTAHQVRASKRILFEDLDGDLWLRLGNSSSFVLQGGSYSVDAEVLVELYGPISHTYYKSFEDAMRAFWGRSARI